MPDDNAITAVRDARPANAGASTEEATNRTAGESREPTERVTVSFIIPALNEEKYIVDCLRSIERLQLPSLVRGIEMIVVDNQSTDRTATLSRERGARVVEVTPKNPSQARNAGARAASGQWLAFVDADCALAPDWLAVCGGHLSGDRQTVAAAGVMRAPGSERTWVERAVYGLTHGGRGADVTAVGWLPTFNLLVCRSAFETVGGFDEALTTCEDCDLGYKLAGLGRQMLDRRTTAAHFGESRTLGELFRREAWRSRGNVRLAMARPFDWSNWLSLLLPLCFVLGFTLSIIACVAAIAAGGTLWPWLIAVGLFPVALVAIVWRKAGLPKGIAFFQQAAVLATYFAGRAVGLFWSFGRVSR